MVIISTSAVDVSIHAVSPALILSNVTSWGSVGAGEAEDASAAAAAGADDGDGESVVAEAAELAADAGGSAQTAEVESANIPRQNRPINLFNDANPHDDRIALHIRLTARIRTGCESSKDRGYLQLRLVAFTMSAIVDQQARRRRRSMFFGFGAWPSRRGPIAEAVNFIACHPMCCLALYGTIFYSFLYTRESAQQLPCRRWKILLIQKVTLLLVVCDRWSCMVLARVSHATHRNEAGAAH